MIIYQNGQVFEVDCEIYMPFCEDEKEETEEKKDERNTESN